MISTNKATVYFLGCIIIGFSTGGFIDSKVVSFICLLAINVTWWCLMFLKKEDFKCKKN